LKETLTLELKNSGYRLIDDALWKSKQEEKGYSLLDLIDSEKTLELGKMVNADIIISQFYYIENNHMTLGLKCYDLKTKSLIAQSIQEGRLGLSISSTINEVIAELIPQLKLNIQPIASVGEDLKKDIIIEEIVKIPVFAEKGKKVNVHLQSPDNDVELYLADEKIGSMIDGVLDIEIQANSNLLLSLKKPGYHTESIKIAVGDTDLAIPLKQLSKITNWGLKAEYSFFQFLGAGLGARLYFLPDVLGVDFTNYPYLQLPQLPTGKIVLHNDTNITMLLYPFIKPSSFYRFNLIAGVGMISTFIFQNDAPVFFDFYTDFGMTLVELNFPRYLIYFKIHGRYFFDIFQSGLIGTRLGPPLGVQLTYGVSSKW